MRNARLFGFLCGLVLPCLMHASIAHATSFETWVSGAGNDTGSCTRTNPCGTFQYALSQTTAGGQINVIDTGEFGGVTIDRSITIENDASGTAHVAGAELAGGGAAGNILIAAGPNDVVTLRGIAINGLNQSLIGPTSNIAIYNAGRVNIERCTIRNATGPGIILAPNNAFGTLTLASTMILNIDETVVTGSASGVKVTAVQGMTVNASISRSVFKSNSGAGIRINGLSGGTITASIRDSESSLNAGNGIIALSGPGNVTVNMTRSVFASNVGSGVQSNATSGGTSAVTLRGSTVTNNAAGQINFFGGGATLQTFGDNNIVGPNGTGFTGGVPIQ